MALVIAMLSLTNLSTTALPVVLPLQVSYDDPIVILGNPHKSPILTPVVEQDGHQLTFEYNNRKFELQLVQDGEVVYSTMIPRVPVTISIPSTIEGDYEIRLLTGGDYYFYGYITL